jgi:hypothetical protein
MMTSQKCFSWDSNRDYWCCGFLVEGCRGFTAPVSGQEGYLAQSTDNPKLVIEDSNVCLSVFGLFVG